jgi:hypothetical protein
MLEPIERLGFYDLGSVGAEVQYVMDGQAAIDSSISAQLEELSFDALLLKPVRSEDLLRCLREIGL